MSTWGSSKNNDPGRESKRSSRNVTPVNTPPRWQTPPPETPSPPPEVAPVGTTSPRGEEIGSRPASMLFSRNPPLMAHEEDTPPELSPIFSFLNIHTSKVYQEGYFLKLNDQDSHGRPCVDRQWVECYAQLVGTVLSLWVAAALDAAGGEEVPATYINLADASIKMIETLPIRNGAVQPLKNVLSLSSAGKNRYLLHFSSFHSMLQWTAAIRLAMFEHTSLYEAYTGSLIAAKGKALNGIQSILAPNKFKHEDWARVRFGAGTPWRRCWFVITPPDEKDLQKAKRLMKKSAYDRLTMPVTGSIKFYSTRKIKKAQPIATVTNVYSAYAIYPQSKALIDQSSLVKLEGRITLHGGSEVSTEGLVFVMPERHAAVSGFETMLRFLFPTFDTFNLYGRPTRLVADVNHLKSIMFAFPKQRRYGYLDILDITNLLQIPGSLEWTEAEWRKRLKEATQKRMSAGRSRTNSVNSSKPRYRASISSRLGDSSVKEPRQHSALPEANPEFNSSSDAIIHEVPKADPGIYHARGMSDTTGLQTMQALGLDSRVDHSFHASAQDNVQPDRAQALADPIVNQTGQEDGHHPGTMEQKSQLEQQLPPRTPPSPVIKPPTFAHGPQEMPANRPQTSNEQRLANNRMSHTTLMQIHQIGKSGSDLTGAANNSQDIEQFSPPIVDSTDHRSGHFGPYRTYKPDRVVANQSSDEDMSLAFPPHSIPTANTGLPTPSTDDNPSPQLKTPTDLGMKPVKRKPLPQRQLFKDQSSPISPASEGPTYDDLRHTLDEDALNRIAPQLSSPTSMPRNEEDSLYDAASTVSPDYASTHESVYSEKSIKRMGVKKIAGEPASQDLVIGDAHYTTSKPAEPNPDIPDFDFGPTLAYMPTTGRPTTGDAIKRPSHNRQQSDLKHVAHGNTLEQGHVRSLSQEERRRSVPWQPGMASIRLTTPGGGLTPEQFVQQRAAPSPPLHMHQRTSSRNGPTQVRPISGDWTNQARPHSRMTSYPDANPRPSSRGANSMITSFNDVSGHLSAREQEHVARMTGSSFFNISGNSKKAQPQVNPMGLVSTIDTREREKREIKEGMSNQMVQHAITQRQLHQQYHQQQQHLSYQPQPLASHYAGSVYPTQTVDGMYNLPGASQTWDALHQMGRPDEPRRKSWYGQLAQALPVPSNYQSNQYFPQQSGYPANYNFSH
ncbi:hypothetical protein N7539_005696 [Penicillium diatomitis]|uniref:PH domain-containing protein n=1 Tax=Penicillium diatomitis TaxID=2819901 RepID=A0A9W9X5B4_9EURO|nr:uncharacterized protein N7539_005696 [Penicillium diatomitis]KAJ5483900.1 hypothetical protein N7539_005696 [Penicillium diatomitis]